MHCKAYLNIIIKWIHIFLGSTPNTKLTDNIFTEFRNCENVVVKEKKAKINANVLRKSIKDFFPQKTKQKIEKNNIFVLRRNRHKKQTKIYIFSIKYYKKIFQKFLMIYCRIHTKKKANLKFGIYFLFKISLLNTDWK